MFCDVLREAGYITHAAEDGERAVELVRKEAVDAVLLDIAMPGMTGLDVLAKFGELTPNSPVIIATASPTSDNAISALRLGAFDFIVKGVKSEVLLATVARAVERRRLMVRERALISQLEAKIRELLAILAERTRQSDEAGIQSPQA